MTVLQIDREAYARLEDYEPGSMGWSMITEPSGADCVGVTAFATHREQAVVSLVAALEDCVGYINGEIGGPVQLEGILKDARLALTKANGDA